MGRVNARSFDLPILMYHHILHDGASPESSTMAITRRRFKKHLDFLGESGFSAVSFCDLFAAIGGTGKLPPRSVIISFDDGFSSFADIAVPELVSRNMKATVFIVANGIGKTNWWDAHSGKPLHPLMNDDAIRGVIAAGMDIGVHGWDHQDLTSYSDQEVFDEMVRSREELTRRFGVHPTVFCYPYGYYKERDFALLAKAGHQGAVTIFSDRPTVTDNPFCMRRVYAHEHDGALRFRIKLSSAYLRYVALRDSRIGRLVPLTMWAPE